jgi:zinc ribbon protein
VNADSLCDVSYDAAFEKGNGTIAAKMKKEGDRWKLLSFHVGSPVFQQDIATAKCSKCGAPHSREARFCPACGAAIAPEDATDNKQQDKASDEKS